MAHTNETADDIHGSKKTFKRVSPVMVFGIFAVITGIYLLSWNYLSPTQPESLGVIDRDILINVPADQVPEDALYITPTRREYDGTMNLIIPALELHTVIGTDTDADGLKNMPGLYEFSQMPDETGGNVSIAGHRDICGKEFYYLDKLLQGDYLYLVYNNNVYQYLYHDSAVVPATDWSVIQRQGFTCLTLTTCDPIGTSLKRLVIRSTLVDIQPYSEDFFYDIRKQKISR